MKNINLFIAFGFMAVIFLFSFTTNTQGEPWKVPDKYEKMKNPQEASSESLKIGKRLWKKHCASCHGNEGLGDGSKAKQLDTPAGDFTAEAFTKQSDGALFYKTKFGRDEMPNYEKKIPYDEDVWHVVNFMRSLAE
jgi:mono/diheme cytochrome c family protein